MRPARGARPTLPRLAFTLAITGTGCAGLLDIPDYHAAPSSAPAGGMAGASAGGGNGGAPLGGDAGDNGSLTAGSGGSASGAAGTAGTAGTGTDSGAMGGGGGASGAPEAGAGGADDPCQPVTTEWSFDDGDLDGFTVTYGEPTPLRSESSIAADPSSDELRVTTPFSVDTNELFIAVSFLEHPRDLSGRTAFACVRFVEPLTDDTSPIEPRIFAESGVDQIQVSTIGDRVPRNGTWVKLKLDLDAPPHRESDGAAYDQTDVVSLGLWFLARGPTFHAPIQLAVSALWLE